VTKRWRSSPRPAASGHSRRSIFAPTPPCPTATWWRRWPMPPRAVSPGSPSSASRRA